MPKGSDTMTEGKVLKWLKKEGDAISTGDTVVEIETDKVNMEVEAMGSGVLRKILVGVDKVVPVGELLAVIAKTDEDISALVKADGDTTAASPHPPGNGKHASLARPQRGARYCGVHYSSREGHRVQPASAQVSAANPPAAVAAAS